MKPIRIIQYVIIIFVLILFVPTGFEFLGNALNDIGLIEDRQDIFESNVTGRLPNENKFVREYHIEVNGDLYEFYNLTSLESKIREVHDRFGIQLYFIEYAMEYTALRDSKTAVIKEVKDYITKNINDPYGLYYVVAEYSIGYYDFDYEPNKDYWTTELPGYLVYGDEVDSWWDTEVQRAFEVEASHNECKLGSYNDYTGFINSISEMKVKGTDLPIEEDREPNPIGNFVVFILFSVFPIVLVLAYIRKEVKAYRAEKSEMKAKEIQDILSTPIRDLEDEYAEELRDKYNKEDK